MHHQTVHEKAIKEIIGSPLRIMLSKLSKAQEDEKEQNTLKNTQPETINQVPLISDQAPRFVSCISHDVYNGNIKEYTWDKEKIYVHECLQDDLLMLQNVFEGKIISSLVYPLVFDSKAPQKEISLRSIHFYREVQNDHSQYRSLSSDDKGFFLIGVRDLFIAACRGMLTQDEKELLVNLVNLIDPRDSNIVYKTIDNIDIAPYPTATHKMVRFIEEEKSEEDNTILDEYFVRNELGLLIGFVDPRDLSFHNLENIINLDSLFKAGEDFRITNFQKHGDNEVYTFDLEDENNLLLSLDKCGLYTQPINKLSRGGERFIFASKILGDNLTSALKQYVSDKTINNYEFEHVNYVFRYNKFKPSDKKFTSHHDTPYHDPARNHYSKYTLLLYLTPGTADPVLSIDNGKLRIDKIENTGRVKGVIFDQKYEHEGKSFIDSDKIFLRSELIYSYSGEDLSFNADVSRKFNIACYMTKQSIFNPELERYASDCFNQVAQARLNLAKAKLTKDVLIYKKYGGVPFITNGYDYWFLKRTCLKTAAIMTLLDYFSGKYLKSQSDNSKNQAICLDFDCHSDSLEEVQDVQDIFKYLKNYAGPEKGDIENISNAKNTEETKEEKTENTGDDYDLVESLKYDSEGDDGETFNSYYEVDCWWCPRGHPTKREVREFVEENHEEIRDGITEAKEKFTVFIFNEEIKIETSKIQINEDSIVFGEKIPIVNFASCQFGMDEAEDLFETDEINLTGYANIPPIQYTVHPEGYHLKIELFNNGFVRKEEFNWTKYHG